MNDIKMNEWFDIEGFGGMYKINKNGDIKNCIRNKIKAQRIDKLGYKRVILQQNGISKNCLVHRLVAKTFIPNPDNLPQVNHKDENKTNNSVNNLEWCTAAYNSNYGTRTQRAAEKTKIINKGKHFSPRTEFKKGENQKKVICIELNKIFESITEAGEYLKIASSNIINCCKHRKYNKTAKGYHFEYYGGN